MKAQDHNMDEFNVYDEIELITNLIDQARPRLTAYRISGAEHYLSVGENQFALEYIMLEIIEKNIPIVNDREHLRGIAKYMKMDLNECNDDYFWEKFTEYLGK